MFERIIRLFNYLNLKYQNDQKSNSDNARKIIPDSITQFKNKLKQKFAECSDFNIREITLGEESQVEILVAFIDGLVDKEMINGEILESLMVKARQASLNEDVKQSNILDIVQKRLVSTVELNKVKDFNEVVNSILTGDTIIYIDGESVVLKAGTKGWETRGVKEPDIESVVRGPREGFTETLRINTSLVRRKIKNPNFKLEKFNLGKRTNTDVCIGYIKDLAHEDIVETVRRRLNRIETDAILESGYIEEFIEDGPFSLFPTVGNSEKPDVVAAKILEGRVAIFCDGTPFVLTVPHLFIETLQASEDYYARAIFSSLIRWLRVLALGITVMAPGFYVAGVTFHQSVIPFRLLLTIAASREGIPFSAFIETLLMGIAYELLREAGVRMPRPVGQAVSIVGALVLGQAAVEAGIASNPVIIITAITAISSLILPPLRGVLPIIRFGLLITANILGFMGMGLVLSFLIIHMATLRSFGVPYLAPFSPLSGMDLKDTFIRAPVWAMWTRPRALIKNNIDSEEDKYRTKKDIRTKED